MNSAAAGDPELGATMERLGREARAAARLLARAPRQVKDAALEAAAAALRSRAEVILAANARDLEAATENILAVRPGMRILPVSSKCGHGMENLFQLLAQYRSRNRRLIE